MEKNQNNCDMKKGKIETKTPFFFTKGSRYVVANWKMNKNVKESSQYIEELLSLVDDIKKTHIWLAVPFTSMAAVTTSIHSHGNNNNNIVMGAQNMNDATSGSFTGEIAATMLQDAGCSFAIIGHSERRKYFHETDEFINKKVLRACECGLTPILCVGETYEQRQTEQVQQVLTEQIQKGLKGLFDQKNCSSAIIIAYEPVWAIGTGKSATPDIIQSTHALIRQILAEVVLQEKQQTEQYIPLLYGGSITDQNAADIIAIENVDGFLVGTASLQPMTFATIATKCETEKV